MPKIERTDQCDPWCLRSYESKRVWKKVLTVGSQKTDEYFRNRGVLFSPDVVTEPTFGVLCAKNTAAVFCRCGVGFSEETPVLSSISRKNKEQTNKKLAAPREQTSAKEAQIPPCDSVPQSSGPTMACLA